MVFSKSWCPYSQRAKKLLGAAHVQFGVYELDLEPDGADLQGALAEMTKWATVPNIFINGKHFGGCDDIVEAKENGSLKKLLDSLAINNQL